ncbi:MAG: glycosyltransferase [Ardenticatenaceae bacterium]|nr:glycosyltransferase [Ardenticatenaceae bacterium]
MAPTKVMFLVDRLGRGGVAQVVTNVALALDRDKFEPVICVTRDKPAYGQDDLLRRAGVTVIELKRSSRFQLSVWKKLWQSLAGVTILHTHLSGSNFWGRLWGTLRRVPIIITQEHAPAYEKEWYEHLVDRSLSPFSDRIISVSEFDRQKYIELEKIPPEKIETLYVGIDIDKFAAKVTRPFAKHELGLPTDKQIVSVVARLFPQKNHQGFLEALTQLPPEQLAEVHCLFIGSGPLEAQLKSEVARLDLQETITFLGERTDVPQLLAASDMLVLPSHFECLPSVISEAMAAGCAVVATAVGGIPEMLEGVGWPLVPPGDVSALAEAITCVLELPEAERQRLVARGKEVVQARFSKDQSVQKTQQLYERMLAALGNQS